MTQHADGTLPLLDLLAADGREPTAGPVSRCHSGSIGTSAIWKDQLRRDSTEVGNEGWDFAEARPDSTAGLHPYPAKFIGEIPRRLIGAFRPAEGTVVLDPFCGSGTTLYEAQMAGLPSIGVDLNPIATLLSRVRTSPLPPDVEGAATIVVEAAMRATSMTVPDIPRLDHWFTSQVQVELARLAAAISEHGRDAGDVLRLAMSSIIVRVSNQDSDTRYAAIVKRFASGDVLRHFIKAVRRIRDGLSKRPTCDKPVTVLEADVLSLRAASLGKPVGLVVTSPPYPNAYEYWLYHKYRMWWLGFDPIEVKRREIGARAHYFSGPKRRDAEDFGRQMTGLMKLVDDVLVPGGHACFVVGRSRIHGVDVDNAATIATVAERRGYESVLRVERAIAPTRKSFNLSHASIKSESVLVFRKP